MPFSLIPIQAVRPGGAVTATFGTTKTETAVPGSPFLGTVYRVPQSTVQRDEAAPGVATVDAMRRARFADPTTPIQMNDILYIPSANDPSVLERAKVLRVRRYDHSLQCDLETGAEGKASG